MLELKAIHNANVEIKLKWSDDKHISEVTVWFPLSLESDYDANVGGTQMQNLGLIGGVRP